MELLNFSILYIKLINLAFIILIFNFFVAKTENKMEMWYNFSRNLTFEAQRKIESEVKDGQGK